MHWTTTAFLILSQSPTPSPAPTLSPFMGLEQYGLVGIVLFALAVAIWRLSIWFAGALSTGYELFFHKETGYVTTVVKSHQAFVGNVDRREESNLEVLSKMVDAQNALVNGQKNIAEMIGQLAAAHLDLRKRLEEHIAMSSDIKKALLAQARAVLAACEHAGVGGSIRPIIEAMIQDINRS